MRWVIALAVGVLFSGCGPVQENALVGLTEKDLTWRYGLPRITAGKSVIGRRQAPSVDVDETWYWKRRGGHLYAWMQKGVCVESLYFDDDVRF